MKSQYLNTLLALILVSMTTGAWAQKNKLRKAEKQSDNLAYIDARSVYLKVVEKGYSSAQVYQNLGDTYYWNSDYANAAEWYGKLIDNYPEEAQDFIYYRAAQSYKSSGNLQRSAELMQRFSAFENAMTYLGESELTVALFEVELREISGINSDYSDFGPSYLDQSIVFSSTRPEGDEDKIHDWTNQPFSKLYQANLTEEGSVMDVQALRGAFEPSGYQSTAVFTKDGKTMYFTQSQSLTKDQAETDPTMRLKIVRAQRMENNEWGNFMDLPINDVNYSSAHPALSANEDRLYFVSDRPGGFGASDLWYAVILGDSIAGSPVNLGPEVNTAGRETFPFIDQDQMLYFATDARAGMGGLDIYSLNLSDDGGQINHLPEPINGPMDDFGLAYDTELRKGVFTSNRGAEDSQGDQIFGFKAVCQILIDGRVIDLETLEGIPGAQVKIYDAENQIYNEFIVGEDAQFNFDFKCGQEVRMVAAAPGYTPNEIVIQTPEISATQSVSIPLKFTDLCRPNDLGCKLNLQPIYFDFDRYEIRKDAEVELAKILVAMEDHPELVIHIESHTDQRGSDEYNEVLSDKRAASTRAWLIEHGVAPERLTAEGYGEAQPLIDCAVVQCSEVDHQLNRRSVFLVQD